MGSRARGYAWGAAAAVGAALMTIPWKLANQAGDPAISTLLLLLTAAIASTGLRLLGGIGRARRGIGRADVGVAVALAAFTLVGNLASALSIREIEPALHAVLLRSDILFVAVFGALLLSERVEGRFWLGGGLALTGFVVMQGGFAPLAPSALLETGSGLAIAAAICFSLMAVATRRFIRSIDPVTVNSLRLWLSVALWVASHGWPDFAAMPRDQVLNAGLAALFGPFLARLALMQSAKYLEARVTTLVSLSTPVMTLALAYALLGDWPAPHGLLGGAIMIAGIAIPLLPTGRR